MRCRSCVNGPVAQAYQRLPRRKSFGVATAVPICDFYGSNRSSSIRGAYEEPTDSFRVTKLSTRSGRGDIIVNRDNLAIGVSMRDQSFDEPQHVWVIGSGVSNAMDPLKLGNSVLVQPHRQ